MAKKKNTKAIAQETEVHVPEAVENTDTSTTEVIEEKKVTLVIPYLKSEAAGEELKYALRSWESNFVGSKLRVVVIGDREYWFSGNIVHIPADPHLIDKPSTDGKSVKVRDPQADVAHKLLLAITSGLVGGDFIFSNDDIFLLGDVEIAHLSYLKAYGDLKNRGVEGTVYHANAQRTANLLREKGYTTVCYDTHTPVVLNSEDLVEIINDFKATEAGVLIKSAYFNTIYPDARGVVPVDGGPQCGILASVYRENPNKKVLEEALTKRLFLNCNSKGWSAVKAIMKKAFPEKSGFEK